jgi:hypothetical protein
MQVQKQVEQSSIYRHISIKNVGNDLKIYESLFTFLPKRHNSFFRTETHQDKLALFLVETKSYTMYQWFPVFVSLLNFKMSGTHFSCVRTKVE